MKRLFMRLALMMTCFVVLSGQTAEAITFYGSNGLIHVASANNVYRGDLFATMLFDYNQGSASLGTYRNGRGSVTVVYGLLHSLEFGMNQVYYQDQPLFGTPGTGPLRLSLKFAVPTQNPSAINVAGQLIGIIPTGSRSNVEQISYYSDKKSYGGTLILSYDTNPVELRRSKRFHLNLGFLNHNDKDSYNPLVPTDNTQQVLFGISGQIPKGPLMIFTELSGEHFLKFNRYSIPALGTGKPDDYIRLTPGIRYQMRKWVIQTGADIRISKSSSFGSDGDFITRIPLLKFVLGIEYRLREGAPPTYNRGRRLRISGRSYYGYGRTSSEQSAGPGVIQNFEEREELINQTERELQQIREERMQAQKALDDLKKQIERTSPQ